MRLWLVDADTIIDLLAMGAFDHLVANHQVHIATSVIKEVQFYYDDNGTRIVVDLRNRYDGQIIEVEGTIEMTRNVLTTLPPLKREAIHDGELESLAVLMANEDLTFCTCDAAAIRTMPYLDCSERGVSVERLLRESGLRVNRLEDKHTDDYFRDNINIGSRDKIYGL